MTTTRREFFASMAAAAAPRQPAPYFGLHPFIETNPKAVFIRRTNVPQKMDSAKKRQEGLALAREIFVPMQHPGVPASHKILLKPNITSVRNRRPDVENWGAGTDPDFYEGLLMGLKEIGVKNFHFAEANMYYAWNYRGFMDIHDRQGVRMCEPEQRLDASRWNAEVNWATVPGGVVYQRIPHFAPTGDSDTWLFNIAKWKAHAMCLTQSVKNEQGLVAHPFVRFCPGWSNVLKPAPVMKECIAPNVEQKIKTYFENHKRNGFHRYFGPNEQRVSPIAQEIWAHKTCDNQSVMKTGLAMVEGIYGRDGDGFGVGDDIMANVVMFSKHKFRLDVVGLWLGGHEPGNVHLYRIAKERGLTDTFNPWEIPVYEWVNGKAEPRKLTDFPRTPMKTPYLRLPNEPVYHMVSERFDYDKYKS